MEVKVGQKYRHFKGKTVEILNVATHSETLEGMIVYTCGSVVWVRPSAMFMERVDKQKYPDVEQEYRFELIEE